MNLLLRAGYDVARQVLTLGNATFSRRAGGVWSRNNEVTLVVMVISGD
jgi:hypothetical protein